MDKGKEMGKEKGKGKGGKGKGAGGGYRDYEHHRTTAGDMYAGWVSDQRW